MNDQEHHALPLREATRSLPPEDAARKIRFPDVSNQSGEVDGQPKSQVSKRFVAESHSELDEPDNADIENLRAIKAENDEGIPYGAMMTGVGLALDKQEEAGYTVVDDSDIEESNGLEWANALSRRLGSTREAQADRSRDNHSMTRDGEVVCMVNNHFVILKEPGLPLTNGISPKDFQAALPSADDVTSETLTTIDPIGSAEIDGADKAACTGVPIAASIRDRDSNEKVSLHEMLVSASRASEGPDHPSSEISNALDTTGASLFLPEEDSEPPPELKVDISQSMRALRNIPTADDRSTTAQTVDERIILAEAKGTIAAHESERRHAEQRRDVAAADLDRRSQRSKTKPASTSASKSSSPCQELASKDHDSDHLQGFAHWESVDGKFQSYRSSNNDYPTVSNAKASREPSIVQADSQQPLYSKVQAIDTNVSVRDPGISSSGSKKNLKRSLAKLENEKPRTGFLSPEEIQDLRVAKKARSNPEPVEASHPRIVKNEAVSVKPKQTSTVPEPPSRTQRRGRQTTPEMVKGKRDAALRYEVKQGIFRCPDCRLRLEEGESLATHKDDGTCERVILEKSRKPKKLFKCKDCGKVQETDYGLRYHQSLGSCPAATGVDAKALSKQRKEKASFSRSGGGMRKKKTMRKDLLKDVPQRNTSLGLSTLTVSPTSPATSNVDRNCESEHLEVVEEATTTAGLGVETMANYSRNKVATEKRHAADLQTMRDSLKCYPKGSGEPAHLLSPERGVGEPEMAQPIQTHGFEEDVVGQKQSDIKEPDSKSDEDENEEERAQRRRLNALERRRAKVASLEEVGVNITTSTVREESPESAALGSDDDSKNRNSSDASVMPSEDADLEQESQSEVDKPICEPYYDYYVQRPEITSYDDDGEAEDDESMPDCEPYGPYFTMQEAKQMAAFVLMEDGLKSLEGELLNRGIECDRHGMDTYWVITKTGMAKTRVYRILRPKKHFSKTQAARFRIAPKIYIVLEQYTPPKPDPSEPINHKPAINNTSPNPRPNILGSFTTLDLANKQAGNAIVAHILNHLTPETAEYILTKDHACKSMRAHLRELEDRNVPFDTAVLEDWRRFDVSGKIEIWVVEQVSIGPRN